MNMLTKFQQKDRSALSDLIESGKPTALTIESVSRKNSRVPHPRLFLVLLSSFGGDDKQVLVSLEGHLCEVMKLYDMDRDRLWRIGLTYKAADMLINEIGVARELPQRSY